MPRIQDSFSSKLSILIDRIIKETTSYVHSQEREESEVNCKPRRITERYKPEFRKIEYTPSGINYSLVWILEYLKDRYKPNRFLLNLVSKGWAIPYDDLIEWDSSSQFCFFHRFIEPLKEYKEVHDEISEKCPDDQSRERGYTALHNFARAIISKTYEGGVEEALEQYTAVF